MKKYILLLAGLLSLEASRAQNEDYISLSFTNAVPIGGFAHDESDYDFNTIGFAQAGFGFDFSYVNKSPNSHFGFTATARRRVNKLGEAPLFTDLSVKWTRHDESWKALAFMGGFYYGRPLSRSVVFNTRLVAGVAKADLPKMNWTGVGVNGFGGNATFLREDASALALSTSASVGLEVSLAKKLCLLGSAGYWHLKPSFRDVYQQFSVVQGSSSYGGNSVSTYAVDMSTLDINVGLAFKL